MKGLLISVIQGLFSLVFIKNKMFWNFVKAADSSQKWEVTRYKQ